jgi:hypothetical protein
LTRHRLLRTLALAGWFAGPVVADALPERAERIVDYRISVRLDPDEKALEGRQTLVWRNPSGDAVGELWFHLYLNAFRNSESTFFRESGGRLRRDQTEKDNWGWIDVTSIELADGTDLLAGATFEAPDDGNVEDRTVLRVPLPAPVPPGGEIAVEIDFAAVLPEVYARTGWSGDFFLVGQWFPKLGVYEPAGTRGRASGGWNCHQFHAHSEFYADYGRFRVELTVPDRFVTGATGRRTSSAQNADGTRTEVWEQEDVHDFAWTADPGYLEVVDRFDAEAEVTAAEYAAAAARLGRPVEELRLTDVEIRLLLQPEHRPQADRHLAAAKHALEWFGLAYGRYPYATLTVVDPPATGSGASGMEYPTFITGGTSVLLQHWPLEGVRAVEEVVIHEFGHQYWYGLVGSNEFEESWLDEGFTSYSTVGAMEAAWGTESSLADLPGLDVGDFEVNLAQNSAERRFDRIRTRAWDYSSSGNYGFNSYARTVLLLRTLGGLVGEETLARILRTYHERWRFRHPASEDFYAVAEEVSGRELDDFFARFVDGTGVLDPAVTAVSSLRETLPRGRLERGGVTETITEKMARAEEREAEEAGARRWRSVVQLRHLGELRLPVEVELRFEGVPPERRVWEGGRPWARWEIVRPEKLVEIVVDPDGKLALDVSRFNNSRRVEPDGRSAALWTVRLLGLAQRLLAGFGI